MHKKVSNLKEWLMCTQFLKKSLNWKNIIQLSVDDCETFLVINNNGLIRFLETMNKKNCGFSDNCVSQIYTCKLHTFGKLCDLGGKGVQNWISVNFIAQQQPY